MTGRGVTALCRNPRQDVSVSGYWRRHLTDEGWRRIKRQWNAEVEQDVPVG